MSSPDPAKSPREVKKLKIGDWFGKGVFHFHLGQHILSRWTRSGEITLRFSSAETSNKHERA